MKQANCTQTKCSSEPSQTIFDRIQKLQKMAYQFTSPHESGQVVGFCDALLIGKQVTYEQGEYLLYLCQNCMPDLDNDDEIKLVDALCFLAMDILADIPIPFLLVEPVQIPVPVIVSRWLRESQ